MTEIPYTYWSWGSPSSQSRSNNEVETEIRDEQKEISQLDLCSTKDVDVVEHVAEEEYVNAMMNARPNENEYIKQGALTNRFVSKFGR